MTLKWPFEVAWGQRSWRSLTKSATKNICSYRHLWPAGKGLAAAGNFSLSWLWNNPLKVIPGHSHCGFGILCIKFIVMFISNNATISHRWAIQANTFVCDLQGQRSRCPLTNQCMGNNFVNKHPQAAGKPTGGLPAMDDFNFRNQEMTLLSHPR